MGSLTGIETEIKISSNQDVSFIKTVTTNFLCTRNKIVLANLLLTLGDGDRYLKVLS